MFVAAAEFDSSARHCLGCYQIDLHSGELVISTEAGHWRTTAAAVSENASCFSPLTVSVAVRACLEPARRRRRLRPASA